MYQQAGVLVSTHSRPKAAGFVNANYGTGDDVSTHSRPKAAGSVPITLKVDTVRFQHTAARRRLAKISACLASNSAVSTHSRPKAAGGIF